MFSFITSILEFFLNWYNGKKDKKNSDKDAKIIKLNQQVSDKSYDAAAEYIKSKSKIDEIEAELAKEDTSNYDIKFKDGKLKVDI